jgi:putative transposase
MRIYAFMEREKANFAMRPMSRVLGVSPSGYWAWRRGEPSARVSANAQLTQHIVHIHHQSRGTYGALRIQAELRVRGLPCGHNRVARLLRQAGLVGCHRRRPVHVRTTRRDPAAIPAPDLVERRFAAPAPDHLWIADITYLPTEHDGFLYLAVILDVFSRRVVGWSMQDHPRTELVLAALEMAVGNRRPEAGLIHHSDHGCQYTSLLFGERCAAAGIRSSMGTVGDCYDNAMAKSFFATLECELLVEHRFQTHDEARAAVFEWIEVFYNRQRRHSALGYVAPAVYEQTVTALTSGAA